MLKGTSYYNPVLNPERALRRRNVVLAQMVKRGVLSRGRIRSAKTQPIRLDFERQPEAVGPAPHLAVHIRKWLIDWADRNDHNIYSDGLIVHTTIDSRLQALANQAVNRQMEALQAVADVEWGMSSDRLISSSANAYVEHAPARAAFRLFSGKPSPALFDLFIRESAAYRRAVDAGTKPEAALAQLKSNKEFMAKLRAEKSACRRALSPSIRPPVTSRRGSVAATSRPTNSIMWRKPGGNRARPSKRLFTAPRSSRECRPISASSTALWKSPLPDGKVWRPSDASAPTGRAHDRARRSDLSRKTRSPRKSCRRSAQKDRRTGAHHGDQPK